jgi:hypothetical protein
VSIQNKLKFLRKIRKVLLFSNQVCKSIWHTDSGDNGVRVVTMIMCKCGGEGEKRRERERQCFTK